MGKLFNDLMEAIRGTEQDFTSGSLRRAIFLLAVPMVLEMAMESVFAVVDIYCVSFLGADAIAAVGITESLITLVYAIAIGLSVATTAMVARRIGEKRRDEAAKAAFQAIFTGLLVSLAIGIPGAILAPKLLKLMHANETIVSSMSGYARLMLGGNAVIMLLFIMNAVFRSAGDAAISMRVLWIANLLNLVLDPVLIFGLGPFPELGVTGAAIATNLGRGLAVAYQFYLLFSGRARVQLGLQDIAVRWGTIRRLIQLAIGGVGQNIVAMSSWIGLMRIVAKFGSEVVAGYIIAIRIVVFVLLPSWGISNAAATLVGQNLGALQPERAEQSIWATGKVNMVFMGIISVLLIVFPRPLIAVFSKDPTVIASGVAALRTLSYAFAFYGLGAVLVQSLNGAGDTKTPTLINLVCFWLFEIPLAYVLANAAHLEEQGVFYAIITAETAMTLAALHFVKRGRWKLKAV